MTVSPVWSAATASGDPGAGQASFPVFTEVKAALESIAKLITKLMASAEAKCQLLCTGPYEFSPIIKYYKERC